MPHLFVILIFITIDPGKISAVCYFFNVFRGIFNLFFLGYDCVDYELVDFNWKSLKSTKNVPLKALLLGFFTYYASFDFNNDVVCPLLGVPVKKSKFTANGKKLPSEMFAYVKNLENRKLSTKLCYKF